MYFKLSALPRSRRGAFTCLYVVLTVSEICTDVDARFFVSTLYLNVGKQISSFSRLHLNMKRNEVEHVLELELFSPPDLFTSCLGVLN